MLMKPGILDYQFLFMYTFANFLPSFIWTSRPADLVCELLGKRADDVLELPLSAKNALKSIGLLTIRSIAAGVFGSALLVRMMDIVKCERSTYANRIYLGREKLLPGTNQRIIRIIGAHSDVTELATTRNILPVFDNPESGTWNVFFNRISRKLPLPLGWHIPKGKHGLLTSWGVKKDGDAKTSSFQIRREWLLPIDDVSAEMRDQNESKSKVLVIEADLSCRSDCEIGEKYFDLNPHDAVNSLKMISFLCHTQSILGPKDLIRLVALGNGSKLMKTLGGGTISLRDFMEQNGCYRFLDTKELMSRAVAQWIEAKGKMMEGNLKTVWLDVSTSRKAEYLKNIIESLGWKVRLNSVPVSLTAL